MRVHRPTKAFLEGTLVFSSSPSEHQAALFQRLCSKRYAPKIASLSFTSEYIGNGILANCHSGEQYYNPPGRTWKPLILASQLTSTFEGQLSPFSTNTLTCILKVLVLNLERDNLLYGSVVQQKGTQTSMKNIFQKCISIEM